MIELRVILNGGKPVLTAQGTEGKPAARYLMTLKKEEANLNKGRFKNFLPLPHGIQEKDLLKFTAYIVRPDAVEHNFSYVVEWAGNIDGKWFIDFTDYTNPNYFVMYFELQEDVLLFKMMFPESD